MTSRTSKNYWIFIYLVFKQVHSLLSVRRAKLVWMREITILDLQVWDSCIMHESWQVYYVFYIHPIGHFQAFCLCVKTSLNVRPFIWFPPTYSFHDNQTQFRTKTRFETDSQGNIHPWAAHRSLWLICILADLILDRVFLSWNSNLCVNLLIRWPGVRPLMYLWAIMESYKNNLSETESHLSDFKPSEMWLYFLRPITILPAKFWTNCHLFTLEVF